MNRDLFYFTGVFFNLSFAAEFALFIIYFVKKKTVNHEKNETPKAMVRGEKNN